MLRGIAYVLLPVLVACAIPEEGVETELPFDGEATEDALLTAIPCDETDVCVPGQVRVQCGAAIRERAYEFQSVQEFTVPRSGPYTFVRVPVRRLFAAATGALRVRVVTLPSPKASPQAGTVLGQAVVSGSLLPRANAVVTFRFDTPINLQAASGGAPLYALWFDVPDGRLSVGLGCSALPDAVPGASAGLRKILNTSGGSTVLAWNYAARDLSFGIGRTGATKGACQDTSGAACDDGNTTSGDGCSASCAVEAGWTCSGVPSTCADLDECATGADDCHPLASCTNTSGGFTCTCPSTLVGNGRTCTEFDACVPNPCFSGVSCTDLPGTSAVFGTGFTCGACPDDTWGDGRTCTALACPVGYTNTASGCVVRPRPTIGANNSIDVIDTFNGQAYLGGRISRAGLATGSGVRVDASTGAYQATASPRILGAVTCSTPDAATGWFVGGSFSHVNGVAQSNLAHVLADGSLDPAWTLVPNGAVNALFLDSGVLYVGGTFTSLNGTARNRLAAFNATTGDLLDWNPGADGSVDALAVTSGVVFAGGGFANAGGAARSRLAAFDATSGALLGWDPGANGNVQAIVASGGNVYAGGLFTTAGGSSRNRLAAFDVTTGALLPWNPDANGAVYALTAASGVIWAGGDFSTIGGAGRSRLASIDGTTGAVGGFGGPVNDGRVSSIVVHSGSVYVAGSFTLAGNLQRYGVAAFDPANSSLRGWNPVAFNGASTISARGTSVFFGGSFYLLNMAIRRVVSADPATGSFGGWGVNAPGVVTGLKVRGNDVFISGSFSTMNGSGRSNLGAVDATTAAVRAWNPGANDWATRLAVLGNRVFSIGNYTAAAGLNRASFVAIDATTGAGLPEFPVVDGYIDSVAVGEGKVFLSGAFLTVGGQPRERLAAIDATTGELLPWNPGADATPSVMVAKDGVLYVGGFFSRIAGINRPSLAAIDIATGAALPWNPAPNNAVFTMQLVGSKFFIGGWFSSIGGQPRNGLAAIDRVTGAPTAWAPSPAGGSVRSLAVDRGIVFVGGEFTSADNFPAPSFVMYGQ